jgi:hypothetical protein
MSNSTQEIFMKWGLVVLILMSLAPASLSQSRPSEAAAPPVILWERRPATFSLWPDDAGNVVLLTLPGIDGFFRVFGVDTDKDEVIYVVDGLLTDYSELTRHYADQQVVRAGPEFFGGGGLGNTAQAPLPHPTPVPGEPPSAAQLTVVRSIAQKIVQLGGELSNSR